MLKLAACLAAVLTLSGCSLLGVKHVYFGERIQGPQADSFPMNVYFDRKGHLYPERDIVIDDAQMSVHLTLDHYFADGKNTHCASPARALQTPRLCALSGMENREARLAAWRSIQDEWFESASRRLSAEAASRRAPVMMLIHGFRVKNAGEVYGNAADLLKTHAAGGQRPVLLQVHWDGLSSPTPFGAWGKAQVNGFLVGLSLRRVLAGLDAQTPVRVMTHSSGAFVLSATLGDPAAAFEGKTLALEEFAEFQQHAAGTPRFPLPRATDLRAALIVPATPPATYTGGADAFNRARGGMLVPAKLIIGLNEKDFGVSKGPFDGGWSIFGSTQLGEDVRGFCILRSQFAERTDARRPPTPALIDFEGTEDKTVAFFLWESHNWENYLKRAKMQTVLDLLFTGDLAAPGEVQSCTG